MRRSIDAQEPSFAYKIRESQAAWRVARQLKIISPLQAVDHKLNGARFARSLGVHPPQTLSGPCRAAELLPPSCSRFALKPLRGTSSRGVLLLERDREGFYDILSGIRYGSWLDALNESVKQAGNNGLYYAEELVSGSSDSTVCPDDFKFYCFYGKVGLILQKRRLSLKAANYKWLNRSWEAVDTGKYRKQIDPNLKIPVNHSDLLNAAEVLSAAIPTPFVRIDLFSSAKAVVFGEFTPHPGGFHTFSKIWDTTLGAWFEDAAARLHLDLLHRKFDLEAFWARVASAPKSAEG